MAARNVVPPRVLWVEGKDDSAVVQSLCNRYRLPQVFKVEEKESVDALLRGLAVALREPGLERLGIVVDANGDPDSRWASIRDTLQRQGYGDVPDHLHADGCIAVAPRRPRFGAWIMPDNGSSGMLEDFVATLVPAGDFLWDHAGGVIDGIPAEHRRFAAPHRSKAHVRTWLAWQDEPGAPMGQAITKRYLDADAPEAQNFVAWLRRLFVDPERESDGA